MKLILDKYAHLDSPIHRWEQKYKLISLLALIFSFAFVQDLFLLLPMVLVTATLYILSRLPLSFLLNRLRYPGLFILAVIIFLPFVSGKTVIFSYGILKIKQEGCLLVLLIVTRFVCILTVTIVLFGTATFLNSIKAMRSLLLPPVIVDMMLLSYRYLEELGETLTTMQRAMKLRGFANGSFSFRYLNVLARLVGTLLFRSYEQSTKVYHAMILRGYGNTIYSRTQENKVFSSTDKLSWIASGLTMAIALSFFLL